MSDRYRVWQRVEHLFWQPFADVTHERALKTYSR
jgi:hypothetical protein